MNAFKAYKACVPIAWSSNIYITQALRLGKSNRTIMRWNTPTVRGMLQQVKRLVLIETEEMYKARMQKQETHRAIRPIAVGHHSVPAKDSFRVIVSNVLRLF
ncbi:hypothetical protein MKW92_024309 [Papaver armeniacum]|nr:hypothetical protein MKW92_024309 [Papaver armeniacum]